MAEGLQETARAVITVLHGSGQEGLPLREICRRTGEGTIVVGDVLDGLVASGLVEMQDTVTTADGSMRGGHTLYYRMCPQMSGADYSLPADLRPDLRIMSERILVREMRIKLLKELLESQNDELLEKLKLYENCQPRSQLPTKLEQEIDQMYALLLDEGVTT